jgi:prepilin-type N-terminal cleavage/methylation domain-containing protein
MIDAHLHNERRGFTLIEVLVTIGVIALLIGLLVPVIAASMLRARELASAANLRSIGQMVEAYTVNNRGQYPAATPGRMYPAHIPTISMTIAHWYASDHWPGLFADTHPWWEYESLYLARGAERFLEPPVFTLPRPSYVYSSSFLGQPAIWSGDTIDPARHDALARSVTAAQVRFPGAKALMWDWELTHLRRAPELDDRFNLLEETAVLFADQHVAAKIPAEATPGVPNTLDFVSHPIENLHNTPDGVQGRDY